MARIFNHPTAGKFVLGLSRSLSRHVPTVIMGASLSIADFPLDKVNYHAQASSNLALVPLSGTGTPGATVEFSALALDDGGYDTTAWTPIATVDGSGNWSAYAAVPRSTSWYQARVRDAGNTAVTASAPKKFGTGLVTATWGQSEYANMTAAFYESSATATVIPKRREAVKGLKYNKKLRGRQSQAALKVPGVDALPSGWSYNAGAKYLQISSGIHLISNWDLSNIQVQVDSGVIFGLTDCKLNYDERSPIFYGIRWTAGSTFAGLVNCDITTPGGDTAINPFIKMDTGTIIAGNVTRNSFIGCPTDPLWVASPAAGATLFVAWNYFKSDRNMPLGSANWSSATTYSVGDGVFYNGLAYIAKTAHSNSAPSGTNADTANWKFHDPHLDLIYFTGGGTGTIRIENNYMEVADSVLLRGFTNFVRLALDEFPSQANFGSLVVQNNHMKGPAANASRPFQFYQGGGYTYVSVTVRWNAITPSASGDLIHPGTGGGSITWGENTNALTGATFATPAEATATDSTADTSDADNFQVVWHNRSPEGSGAAGVQRQLVSNASYGRKQFTGAAAQWAYWRPGEKCTFILCADPGRGFGGLFDDSDTDSYWADDIAAFNHGRAGGYVGLHIMSWYASPSGLGANYGNAVLQLISGKRSDGTPITPRAPIYAVGTTVHCQADHLWSQIYDYTKAKVLISGPHRRDPVADLVNFETYAAGGTEFVQRNYGLCRQSVRDTFPHAQAPYVSDKGVDAINVEFGYWNAGQNDWWDNIHPSPSDDGSKRFFALSVLTALHGDGLVHWDVPEIDNAYWAPGGTYMEMWSGSWTASTTRKARGEAAMATTFPHRTEVFSIEINGVPAQNATIVNGRIRVAPNSGTFNASTVITFGEGGASGFIAYPEDAHEGGWKNSPIGLFPDGPIAGVEGISFRPKPNPAVLASTL